MIQKIFPNSGVDLILIGNSDNIKPFFAKFLNIFIS